MTSDVFFVARKAAKICTVVLTCGLWVSGCSSQPSADATSSRSELPGESTLAATESPQLETTPEDQPSQSPAGWPPAEARIALVEHTAQDDGQDANQTHADPSVQLAIYNEDEGAGEPSSAQNSQRAATDAPQDKQFLDDWQQPAFVLFVTGRQHGYIEPCGCTGLENAKGGLSRRHTMLEQIKARGWPVAPIDVGNQVRRFGKQADIKFQRTIGVLDTMDYQAIGFGPDDLRLTLDGILAPVAESGNFVCANVDLLELNSTHREFTVNGHRVGITGVLGLKAQKEINASPEVVLSDPVEALNKVLPQMRESRPEFMVLLAHASLDETREIVKQFPNEFDLVVTAGGAGEPTLEPETIEGSKSRIIQVGTKGMYVGLVGVFDDPQRPVRYGRVALDARFADSEEVLTVFADYQNQLKLQGLDGLGVKPQPHPTGHKFVGYETCGECHTEAMEVFEQTPHHHTTMSLVEPTERSSIPRHFDPECLSCHVTGWNAQQYFPYQTGYLDVTNKLLHANGCENCHGPGSAHVAVEQGDVDVTDEERDRLRAQMRLTLEDAKDSARDCYNCHDLDNSPEFDFDAYWAEIEHHGVD